MGANVLQEEAINNYKIEMLTLIYIKGSLYVFINILNIHSEYIYIYILY